MIVRKSVDFSLEHEKKSSAEAELMMGGFIKPFDLETAPLLRAKRVSVSDDRHFLCIDSHYLVSHELGLDVIVRELGLTIQALMNGSTQYADVFSPVWRKL